MTTDPQRLVLGPRSRRMLKVLLWTILAGGLISNGYNTYTDPSIKWGSGIIGLVSALVCGSALWMLKQGRERLALMVFCWGMFAFFVTSGIIVAGVRTPALSGMMFIVIVTSWMLSVRQGAIMATLGIAFVVILAFLQHTGLVDYHYLRPPLNSGFVLSLMIALSAIFGVATSTEIREENERNAALSESLQHELLEHQRSEQRFVTLFRSNPLPSQIANRNGQIIEVNDAWCTTFGILREAALGKRPRDLNMWANLDQVKDVLQRLSTDGSISNETISLHVGSGEVRQFLLTVSTIEMAGEKAYAANMVDLTDRIAAETAQREMNLQLEARVTERTAALTQAVARLSQTQEELVSAEKLASLGAMVAGISHELNTPIGNALTVAGSLRARIHDFRHSIAEGGLKRSTLEGFLSASDEMADLLERSTNRAAHLISSFKQVAVDQTSEQRRQFVLHTLAEDIVATLRPGMKHLPWTIDIAIPESIRCDSYPGPLGQILTNLVQNAATHAFDGREQGAIQLSASVNGRIVSLLVADNGNGMDRATLSRIFDPFFTTKLGKGGSGLGLSICHRIATTVLGGTLSVESTPGTGSRFTLQFPLTASGKV